MVTPASEFILSRAVAAGQSNHSPANSRTLLPKSSWVWNIRGACPPSPIALRGKHTLTPRLARTVLYSPLRSRWAGGVVLSSFPACSISFPRPVAPDPTNVATFCCFRFPHRAQSTIGRFSPSASSSADSASPMGCVRKQGSRVSCLSKQHPPPPPPSPLPPLLLLPLPSLSPRS